MRSRTLREGSVGLLILVGLAAFIGIVLWLRGFSPGNRTYRFLVSFTDVAGMKSGAAVRYRGVDVGKIVEIRPSTNGVNAVIEIGATNLLIPHDAIIEANQSGLVGETTIDITPSRQLPSQALSIDPLSSRCNSQLVICDQDRVNGQIGVSFVELLRSGTRLAQLYGDPAFFNNVNALTKNASVAAIGVSQLTGELSLLSRSVRNEVGGFSRAANSVTAAASQTSLQIGLAASRIGNTADQYSLTAAQLNQLVASANDLVTSNRGNLVETLDSVKQTSDQLRLLVSGFSPTIEQLNSTVGQVNSSVGRANVGVLLGNLETLSTNAATASANLRDISTALNSPTNILVLQQTLDSARATFENAQKITADLDELTGDPEFRNNLKQLVDGLGNLVSSTQQLENQVEVAQTVEPVRAEIITAVSSAARQPVTPQASPAKPEQVTSSLSKLPIRTQKSKLLPPSPKKRSPQIPAQ